MDEKLLRIEEKLDKIGDKIASIDVTIAKQQVSLDEHVKRSNMLEDKMEHMDKEIEPIKKHVYMINGALKLVGILSLIAGIADAIINLVK